VDFLTGTHIMLRRTSIATTLLAIASALSAHAQTPTVQRQETGNRVSENIPAIPAELLERLSRYQNTRGAGVAG
jgi:hypothetical protein